MIRSVCRGGQHRRATRDDWVPWVIGHRSVTGIRVDLRMLGYGATARREPLSKDAKI